MTIFLIGYLGYWALDVFVRAQPLNVSQQALPALFGSAILLSVYYFASFIYQSVKLNAELFQKLDQASRQHGSTGDVKVALADRDVIIGTFTDELLATDIRALIVLGERSKPDVDNYLRRISIGYPYCPKCLRPLEKMYGNSGNRKHISTGYGCPNHLTNRYGDSEDLLKDVLANVRRDFGSYWKMYQSKIHELTGERPDAPANR